MSTHVITPEALQTAGFYEIHWNPNYNGGYFEYRLHAYERPGATVSITFGDRLPDYPFMVWLATVGNRIGLPHVTTLEDLETLCWFLTGTRPALYAKRSYTKTETLLQRKERLAVEKLTELGINPEYTKAGKLTAKSKRALTNAKIFWDGWNGGEWVQR